MTPPRPVRADFAALVDHTLADLDRELAAALTRELDAPLARAEQQLQRALAAVTRARAAASLGGVDEEACQEAALASAYSCAACLTLDTIPAPAPPFAHRLLAAIKENIACPPTPRTTPRSPPATAPSPTSTR